MSNCTIPVGTVRDDGLSAGRDLLRAWLRARLKTVPGGKLTLGTALADLGGVGIPASLRSPPSSGVSGTVIHELALGGAGYGLCAVLS